MASAANQLFPFSINQARPHPHFPPANYASVTLPGHRRPAKHRLGFRIEITPPRASPASQGISTDADGDGVSLGTMKLPPDTDVTRFETLLFQVIMPSSSFNFEFFWNIFELLHCFGLQWANSLCQGANLPLPVPLKVRMNLIEVPSYFSTWQLVHLLNPTF